MQRLSSDPRPRSGRLQIKVLRGLLFDNTDLMKTNTSVALVSELPRHYANELICLRAYFTRQPGIALANHIAAYLRYTWLDTLQAWKRR